MAAADLMISCRGLEDSIDIGLVLLRKHNHRHSRCYASLSWVFAVLVSVRRLYIATVHIHDPFEYSYKCIITCKEMQNAQRLRFVWKNLETCICLYTSESVMCTKLVSWVTSWVWHMKCWMIWCDIHSATSNGMEFLRYTESRTNETSGWASKPNVSCFGCSNSCQKHLGGEKIWSSLQYNNYIYPKPWWTRYQQMLLIHLR